MIKPTIIAFYLPQYHPFKENDEWWGKGFTEWTNVGKAKPLFRGHNQPRVPTELGYYDLRLPVIREQQVQMARDAGVNAFCYWHYWFGNGKRLIPEVFQEVLESGKPDYPFCLGWANHSWFAKNWNADGTTSQKLLIEQTYPGIEDERLHFDFLLRAFRDDRYVKVNGRPLLFIFDSEKIPDEYIENFRKWTIAAGFPDLYLVANISFARQDKQNLIERGFDAVTYQRLAGGTTNSTIRNMGRLGRATHKLFSKIKGLIFHRPPFMTDYKKFRKFLKSRNFFIIFSSKQTKKEDIDNITKGVFFYENAEKCCVGFGFYLIIWYGWVCRFGRNAGGTVEGESVDFGTGDVYRVSVPFRNRR